MGFCDTIALKAEIFCSVGRRDKTKFDLAPPGVELELPATLAQSQLSITTQPFQWAFQRGEMALCDWAQGPKVDLLPALSVPRFAYPSLPSHPQAAPSRAGSGETWRKVLLSPSLGLLFLTSPLVCVGLFYVTLTS